VTFSIAWRTFRFWHLFILFYSGVFYGTYINSVYKTIAVGIKDSKLTLVGALGSVTNGCSRFFWATIQDKYGFKGIYFILLSIQLLSSALIFSFRSDIVPYGICLCLAFLCEGGHFAMFPTVGVNIFGMK